MTVGLLDVGPIELLILTAAAVMLFGGDLPDVARRAGRVLGKLRASARELGRELDPPPDLGRLPPPAPVRREDAPATPGPAEHGAPARDGEPSSGRPEPPGARAPEPGQDAPPAP